QADIFLIVGTSLVVYPAAGLVHYASPGIPIYIVDKKIPYIQFNQQVTAIEKGAGEGLEELMERLIKES
ncbi:MAG: NAD-dependent deacylase, partial [Flavisolibacter sp.]